MSKPFAGLKVLDLTHVLAGPFCAWQFALLGADVIKIENPDEPDWSRGRGPDPAENAALRGLNYQVQGSNKRAIAINLKHPRGRDLVRDLAKPADVLVENYRTGALAALGLGYADIAAINPRIVYCSITGYGDKGPRAETNAYDNVIQAASGAIDQSHGQKPGLSFVDYAAGYNAAFAIGAALFRREREGKGAHISCSMFETALMLMAPELAAAMRPGAQPKRKEAGISPYQTAEGVLMLGAFSPPQNARLWKMLVAEGFDAQGFAGARDWPSLWENADAMRAALSAIFLTRTANDWQALLHAHGLPAERVRPLAEAGADPQLTARNFFAAPALDAESADPLPVAAYRFDADGPSIETPAPGFAAHTDAVLTELGLSEQAIAELRAEAVIA